MSTIAISSSERESLSLLVGRRVVDVIVPLSRTPSGRFIQLDSEREPLAQSWFDIWLDDGAKFTIAAHFIWNGTFEFYTISVEHSIRPSYHQKWSAGPEFGYVSISSLLSPPDSEIASARVLASDETFHSVSGPDIRSLVEDGIELAFASGQIWQFRHGPDVGGILKLTRVGPN
jgi:hypothetical protein